ncbi:MAG TPA: response regulator transcription factor [Puia sp.]|jgi:two-component system invasion response regulator UvrY|nr:response regulator transcription factor [Puia sp.]
MGIQNKKTNVVLVDDHVLLRNGLASHIRSLDGYDVLFEADNGASFLKKLNSAALPDIVLMDINMPSMDGYETTQWLKKHHPEIKVLALSMYDNEQSIIRMLKSGAKGYILKDIEPLEFKAALDALVQKGFYYSEMVTGKLIHAVNNLDEPKQLSKIGISFSEREIEFLKLVCSEKTYKEIADDMNLSPRTIDGYRDAMFEKLHAKTRVGLVMYAIRNGIVEAI